MKVGRCGAAEMEGGAADGAEVKLGEAGAGVGRAGAEEDEDVAIEWQLTGRRTNGKRDQSVAFL